MSSCGNRVWMLTCFGTSPEGPSNQQTNVGRPDAHDPAPPGRAHGAAAKQRERAEGETGGQRMDDNNSVRAALSSGDGDANGM